MLKEIREHYGLSQNQLADYLGVPRSQISMAEGHNRKIPTGLITTLLPFLQSIHQPTRPKRRDEKLSEALAQQQADLDKTIDWRTQENVYKLIQLKRQLQKTKDDHSRAIQVLERAAALKVEAKENPELVDFIERNAWKLLEQTGENSQLKLELQIQGLQAETEYLKKRRK